jgi:hypothetical protein
MELASYTKQDFEKKNYNPPIAIEWCLGILTNLLKELEKNKSLGRGHST